MSQSKFLNGEVISYLDKILIDRLTELIEDPNETIESKVRISTFEVEIINQIKDSLS